MPQSCYENALEILQWRFGDRRQIEQNHLAKLRALPAISSSSDLREHRKLYDHVQGHIRGLRSLGVNAAKYSSMMSEIILTSPLHDIVADYNRQAFCSKRPSLAASNEVNGEVEMPARADSKHKG